MQMHCAQQPEHRIHLSPTHRAAACRAKANLVVWCALVIVRLLVVPAVGADDPAHYVKQSSWQETLLASRNGLAFREQRDGSAAERELWYVSDTVRGGEPARSIRLPVSGLRQLHLFVQGAPHVTYGAATWANAKLIDDTGQETWLCHVKALNVVTGQYDIDRNLKSGVSGPLRIAGESFEHGIHVYADSAIRIELKGKYAWFEAKIGIDDWVGPHGAVRFVVTGPRGADRLQLWSFIARDFSAETARRQMRWERMDQLWDHDWNPGDYRLLADRYVAASQRVPPLAAEAARLAASVSDAAGLAEVRRLYYRTRELHEDLQRARSLELRPLKMAIADLHETYGFRYAAGAEFTQRLTRLEESLPRALSNAADGNVAAAERVSQLLTEFDALRQEALLANPLLDFDKLLLIKRVPHGDPRRPRGRGYGVGEYIGLPRQSSKSNPNIEEFFAWDNEIAVLSPPRPEGQLHTLFRPAGGRLITDLDLHWDAERLLFSMPGSHNMWHVFEAGVDGRGLRQVTPGDQPDVHHYDACYLPNGRIAFVSTAPLQGVPCNAGVIVGMMYVMDQDGTNIRQVCFEQDHTYCPTVLNDGRVMYLRWDYTDTPHVWNRILFTMNPDGTGQAPLYGNNSYWPNAIFYARPIPGEASKIVGIVTGHHVGRVGELVLFDPAQGRQEADGVVQRIPGHGQPVEPRIEDKLTEHSWPKFVHPYPLSDKYFLVSGKPTEDSLWGIYLVDTFDNMVLLKELADHALLEPIPLRKTSTPPVIRNQVELERNDALVYVRDLYAGDGLHGIPRGTVKKLRLFTYHFGYQKLAGITHRVGADGPWEVKQVLGTVPVEEDGSALFRIPARTPLSVQPLDAEGRALALMRSWMTAMPGETLSCAGCHEQGNHAPPASGTLALGKQPAEIQPWHGPARGFSFAREVQPVLDKYCVGCHDGRPEKDGKPLVDLRGDQKRFVCFRRGNPRAIIAERQTKEMLIKEYEAVFEPSYVALRRLIRVGGLESDLHVLPAMEFHAGTSELIQMLRKGHHGVQLDEEAWDRLHTWIDLNAPCHGTWGELVTIPGDQRRRRQELAKLYGGVSVDPEDIPATEHRPAEPVLPTAPPVELAVDLACENWPFTTREAERRQESETPFTLSLEIGDGLVLEFVRIPAGRFIMGDARGEADERPLAVVTIEQPFWISKCEITNSQYRTFDASHDSRFEHRTSWIFSEEYLGWPLNRPDQPVVRVSWENAIAFCRWLSERTGRRFTLPTEAQWEYACRAGTDTPLWFGDLNSDFSRLANMADWTIRDLAYQGWRPAAPDLVPRDDESNDGVLVTAEVGSYQPNAWGLHDMHGNVAEWTRTTYRPYPYRENGERSHASETGDKVVRGGSWYDRPARCRSAYRLKYPPYQRVFNVGFRVVCNETGP